MVLKMTLYKGESSSFMAERKREMGNEVHNALRNNTDRSNNCPVDTSFVHEFSLERDSHVESAVSIGSESGLTEALSNSNLNCLKRKNKRRKKKIKNAPKIDNIDVDLQGVTSETMTAPFRTEAPVDVSTMKISETSPFEIDVIIDMSTKMDLVATPAKGGSFLNNFNNSNNDASHDYPEGASLMQDTLLSRDSYVESMVKTGSQSGLLEAQSNSNLDCLHIEKKKKRPRKKKKLNAPKTDDIDASLQEVTSETITAPLLTEASVDVSIKKIPETASSEVEVMCDARPEMDLVDTPVEVGSFLNNNNNDTSHDFPKGASLMQDIPLGRDSHIESMVKIGSESGLIEEQSNSYLDCLHNKKRKKRPKKKKRLNASETDYMDVNLQEFTTETITGPLGTEASVDVSRKKVPETSTGKGEGMYDSSTKTELVATSIKEGNFLNNNNNTSYDSRKGASLMQDIPLGRDSYVGSIVKIGSESGLIEEQSNSSFDCLHNEKRKKRPKKRKRLNAPKTDYMDVNLQEVTTETNTGTLGTEASVDVSRKVPETATGEVEGMCDTSTKTELVGTPVKIGPMNMSRGQRKRLRKKKLKENRNDSVTTDMFAERDSSLQLPVNIGSSNISMEKQPNEDIGLLLEKNERNKEGDGHKDSENNSPATLQRTNGQHFGKEDVKISPKGLDLDSMKGDFHLSRNHICFQKSTNLMEKQYLPSENYVDSHEKCDAKSSRRKRKRKRKFSKSSVNSSDCIMKNVSVLLEGCLEDKNIEKAGEVKITVQKASGKDGGSVQSSSGSKEKTSDNISDHHTVCKHLKQKNVNLEIKTKEVSPSSHLVIKDDCTVNETNKEGNHQHSSHSVPIRACIGHSKKKLLVLDVNGILVHITQQPVHKGWKPHFVASKKAVFKRPYCCDFLQFCFERFNVGIWTSRIKMHPTAEKLGSSQLRIRRNPSF
ncbi:uncharacterized protein LOC123211670 isoform X2 [Mangifera indica]|uniref:uncharacterized protein LOC123211670 isoform X2 n=1 Tax=Mangifera indica TaxID=29780 RepID=UPI001CF9A176|nr:uncharacterized protein LOC123211670 isoform X2 [Mangifera indica]